MKWLLILFFILINISIVEALTFTTIIANETTVEDNYILNDTTSTRNDRNYGNSTGLGLIFGARDNVQGRINLRFNEWLEDSQIGDKPKIYVSF